MENKKNQNITLKKDTLWKISTFVFAALLVASLLTGGFGLGNNTTGNSITPPSNAKNPEAPAPSAVKVEVDDDAVLGSDDAPVTIIEFSDYQCPYCGRFWSNTLPQIKEEYIDTGKVKLVYRDFPLSSIHPIAEPAAEAVECVGEQGGDEAYFEMHDKIFENQAQLSIENLKMWANEIGYDISDCLDSGEMTSEVAKDLKDGSSAGVRGTPAFFINGQLVSGAQPFSVFQQAIGSQL